MGGSPAARAPRRANGRWSIAFDDLQWAEPTFLDLIEYLLGWIRDAPILIICMARPDLLEQHPGWLGASPGASSIVLDPLSEPEAETLLELLSGETELTTDLFARITEAAEGNPLYVEQMLAMLTENGSASNDLAIPPTIHALLAARLDRLEPEERAVIERAAVIGKEFWRSAIAELTPEEERASSGPRLMSLARKEFIEPGASIFPEEDGFRFRHILIRDAAYLAMPKETRAQLPNASQPGSSERPASARASSTRSSATTSSRRMATGRSSAPEVIPPSSRQERGSDWRQPVVARSCPAGTFLQALCSSRGPSIYSRPITWNGRHCSSTLGGRACAPATSRMQTKR